MASNEVEKPSPRARREIYRIKGKRKKVIGVNSDGTETVQVAKRDLVISVVSATLNIIIDFEKLFEDPNGKKTD